MQTNKSSPLNSPLPSTKSNVIHITLQPSSTPSSSSSATSSSSKEEKTPPPLVTAITPPAVTYGLQQDQAESSYFQRSPWYKYNNNNSNNNSRSPRKRSVTCDAKIIAAHKRPRLKTDDYDNTLCDLDESSLSGLQDSATLNAVWKLPLMIQQFDAISPSQKSYLLFKLLKKSSTHTLQFINSVIMPVLKHDLISTLPVELSRRIVGYLDPFSLSRASCVCRKWRAIIDSDNENWRKLLIEYGYSLQDPLDASSIVYSYKRLYRRHHTLRQNWRKGRAEEKVFYGHEKSVVTSLQFDSEKIVSGADDMHINIYDTATGRKRMTLEGHEGGIWALQYVGNTLVTGSTDRRVRVWDLETGKCTHLFAGHNSTVRCLLIAKPTMINGRLEPAEPLIVTGSRDSTLRVWKLPDPKDVAGHYDGTGHNPYHLRTLRGHDHSVRAVASHGNTLVSGSYDNTVRVWNIETGEMIHTLEGHTQKVYSVVIDTERNRCMSGSLDSTIRIWDLATGECIKRLEGHTVLVGLLGLTNKYLVSAAADSILRVWSPETGICQHALSGHGNSITCFQHDNEKVISGSEGGLKMWDIQSGQFVKDLITDVDGVWRVSFDGRRCVAAVHKKNETSFRILDFGIHGMDD